MFWSRSKFFHSSEATLARHRVEVEKLCEYKGVDPSRPLEAYDFFVYNKTEFDGATLVKDLCDIRLLDLSAMRHDFEYLVNLSRLKGFKWLAYKIKVDWQYGRDMELFGKGILTPYMRSIGLILSTPIYWVISKF